MKVFLCIAAGLLGCYLLYRLWIGLLLLVSRTRSLMILFLTTTCFTLHIVAKFLRATIGRLHPHLHAILNAVCLGSNWPRADIIAFIDNYRKLEELDTVKKGMKSLGMGSVFEWYWRRDVFLAKKSPYLKPLQIPQIYIPGLRSETFQSGDDLEWLPGVLEKIPEIREEVKSVMQTMSGFNVYRNELGLSVHPFIREKDREIQKYKFADWNMFFFYKGGNEIEENHKKCPVTSDLLKSISRLEKTMISFSALKPGRWIPPHYGITNGILRILVPLIIPTNGCRMQVGEDERVWTADRPLVFDDSFRHQVWNTSDQTRVVLFINVFHQDIKDDEVATIEDFLVDGLSSSPLIQAWRKLGAVPPAS
jgi:aspartyl/asparaginyl beta-hydroxylase (cupin superfamily)